MIDQEVRAATIVDMRKLYPLAPVAHIARSCRTTSKTAQRCLKRAGMAEDSSPRSWSPMSEDTVRRVLAMSRSYTRAEIARRLSLSYSAVRYALGDRPLDNKGSHKLTRKQITEIRERAGTVHDRELAEEFGVAKGTIQYHRLIAGKAPKKCK